MLNRWPSQPFRVPVEDQSQNSSKQCNEKTSIHMDGFGHTNLFSLHTHLNLHFTHCLNVEESGNTSKKQFGSV